MCASGAALLSCCGCVCQDGHVTAGDNGHITAPFWRSRESADWQWARGDGVTKFRCCGESWQLLETQLIRPRMNPEMVSPREKEWSSGRCTVLSLHFFSLYSLALNLPSLTIPPPFSKHCQTHKDRKQKLPFEVAGLFQQHALAVRGRKKREKTVSNPEMFPDACFWQGRQ